MDSSSSFFRNEILICQQCCKIFGETVQYQYHDCKPNRERFLKLIANTSEIQLARGIWKSWKTKNPLYQCLEYDESWYFLPEVTKENWLQVSRMLKNGDYMMSKEGTTTTTNNNPKPEAIHHDDNVDELTKMVQDAELVIADDNGSSTSEIDLDNKFCKNVDEVLDFFGNGHGHSYRQKVAPNNFFELKDEVKGEKDEILLDQCNLDPSTGTLFDKNGNTVTTERILRQCQVRDPLTLLNFQPSNSKPKTCSEPMIIKDPPKYPQPNMTLTNFDVLPNGTQVQFDYDNIFFTPNIQTVVLNYYGQVIAFNPNPFHLKHYVERKYLIIERVH